MSLTARLRSWARRGWGPLGTNTDPPDPEQAERNPPQTRQAQPAGAFGNVLFARTVPGLRWKVKQFPRVLLCLKGRLGKNHSLSLSK